MKKKLLSIALSAAVVFTFSFGSVGSAFATTSAAPTVTIDTDLPVIGVEKNTGYETLSDAVKDNNTIIMNKDLTLKSAFTAEKDIEINLNNKTITGNIKSVDKDGDQKFESDDDFVVTITGAGKIIGTADVVTQQAVNTTPKKEGICVSTTVNNNVITNTFAVHDESPKDVKWDVEKDKYGDVEKVTVTFKAYCENHAAQMLADKDPGYAAYVAEKEEVVYDKTATQPVTDTFKIKKDDKDYNLNPDCTTGTKGKLTVGLILDGGTQSAGLTRVDKYGDPVEIVSEKFTLSAKHDLEKLTNDSQPTCITAGMEEGTCKTCGKVGAQNILPATGEHKFGTDEKKNKEAVYDFDAKTITAYCLADDNCTETKTYKATLKTDTLKQQKILTATIPAKEAFGGDAITLKKVKFYGDLSKINTYNAKDALKVQLSDSLAEEAAYTGEEIVAKDSKKDIVVKIENKAANEVQELKEGVDYTVSYENNVNATPTQYNGEFVNDKTKWAQVVITGMGDFSGTFKEAFPIKKGTLGVRSSNFGASENENAVYGKNHKTNIDRDIVLYVNEWENIVKNDEIINAMTVENVPAKNAPVGKYKVTVKVPETDNYKALEEVITYNVNPADLKIEILNASRAYGKANPKFDFTADGLVSGDNIDKLVKITTNAKKSSKVGKYNIVGTRLDNEAANNYNITFKTGKLTVTKATQAITKAKTKATVKKGKSFNIAAKTTSGKVSYKKVSGNKNITVNKNGKVTAKKAIKKGTYKIKVKITAPSTTNYKAKAVTKTITVKVK